MNRLASSFYEPEGSTKPARGRSPGRALPWVTAAAIISVFTVVGCTRDEPPVAHGGTTGSAPAGITLHLWDTQRDLDRAEERLEDSRYPLKPATNPDPNQYGADGGRALRCDLVGVDLFFWTFDDEAKAREAGGRWEVEAGHPLRWTVAGNLLLVLFADDDFTGVSEEASAELLYIFAAEGDGGTEGEG